MPKRIEEYLYRQRECVYSEEFCDEARKKCENAKKLFNALPPNSAERRSAQDVYISLRKDYRVALEDYMDAVRYAKQAKTEAAIAKVVARTPYDHLSLHFAFASIDTDQHKAFKANLVKEAIAEITAEYDCYDARGYDARGFDKYGYAEDGYNDLGINADGDLRGYDQYGIKL
jgi:Xaa-Pro aminopeptidase